MSDSPSTSNRSVWILAILASFGIAFGIGHMVGGMGEGNGVPSGGPLTDGRRYKVPVSSSQPYRGNKDALVTMVEWCDLGGKACLESDAMTAKLLKEHGDKLRHVWRHFSDPNSQDNVALHEFARIALEQNGKFWEVRELLFKRKPGPVTREEFKGYATKLGIDWPAMERTIDEHKHIRYVGADVMFAQRFGVTETPTFYVNGRRLYAPVTYERMDALIKQELVHAKKVKANTGVSSETLYDEITMDGKFEPPLPLAAAALPKSP